ncbi:MAG: VOC family protein [Prolixibacteraceae bacterium]|nr:VOC family protein [Prolixibacteraceae bacterium]MBN2649635.1 VOC family protein [Prolixibacteraceae bacterium]
MKKMTPNLAVANVLDTVKYYQNHLGFALTAAVPETQDGVDQQLLEGKTYVFAMMKCGAVELMFQRTDSFVHDVELAEDDSIGASISFYFEIEGLAELHSKLEANGIKVTKIKTTWYGANEFYLKDLNGYILGFSENN